jgi:hypothetical protein
MTSIKNLKFEFVEYIPKKLREGTIYISISFTTAIHKCCCGCGNEVVTPLSPSGWRLIFDGESISLDPSIGNWNFPCKSHYWIRNNKVIWVPKQSEKEIAGKGVGRPKKGGNFNDYGKNVSDENKSTNFWQKLKHWLP